MVLKKPELMALGTLASELLRQHLLSPLHVYHATTDTVANFQSGDNSVAVNFTALDNSMQIATSNTDGILKNNGAGSLRFFNNGSERARLDSSGSLLIGQTTGWKRES
jgi:hypothetical protein